MDIGERVITLLREKGLYAKELATHLNISSSSISAWGKGSNPNSKYIVGISEFLDVSTHELLTGESSAVANKGTPKSISAEAIELATKWDLLDYEAKAIIKGEILKEYRDMCRDYDNTIVKSG